MNEAALGVLGAQAQFHLPGLFDYGEQGHRLKSRAEPSEQFPQTPHCASRVALRDSVSSREKDTSFEGEVRKGLCAWALMMQGCESIWLPNELRENRKQARSSPHLVVVAVKPRGAG